MKTYYATDYGTLIVRQFDQGNDATEVYHSIWHEGVTAKEYLGEFRTSLSDTVTQVRAHSFHGTKDLGCCLGLETAVLTLADNFGIEILDF